MNEFYIQYYRSMVGATWARSSAIIAASCPSSARLLGASLFGQVTSVVKLAPTPGGMCSCSFPRSSLLQRVSSPGQYFLFS